MLGIEDLKHIIQLALMVLAGDLLKLPRAERGVHQHSEAYAPRVVYTDVALKKYRAQDCQALHGLGGAGTVRVACVCE